MDFLLSNPANSRLHSLNFLNQIYGYPEMLESIDSVLGDPDLEAMFKDPTGPMKFGSAAKKNTMKQRIRMLMEGKSIEQKNKLKKELMTLG